MQPTKAILNGQIYPWEDFIGKTISEVDLVEFVYPEKVGDCPMIDYILKIDWMTTKEFCTTFGVPLPVLTQSMTATQLADKFLQIDAIKHKMFVEKAKELRRRGLRDYQKEAIGAVKGHNILTVPQGIGKSGTPNKEKK